MLNRKKTFISILILMSLVMTLLLPAQPALAADPYLVDGRVLPASKAGDNSDWVEIARYGGSSLILRKDTINRSGFGSTTQYGSSTVRNIVNSWFKSTLAGSARLRNFTSKSNAASQLGYWANIGNGLSTPGTAAGTGDDVAFILSFAEAALFCSTQYVSSNGANYTKSSATAIANFNKLTPLPLYAQPANHWWLRSPGGVAYRVCTIGLGGFNTWGLDMQNGAVNQYEKDSNIIYVRPALWVNSAIFDADSFTISYNANGGTGAPASHTAPQNTYTYLSTTIPSYSGYTFLGWSTSSTAVTPQYTAGQQVYITGNLALYAVWSAIPTYTITYNAAGGTGAPPPQTVQGNTYVYLSNIVPIRDGFKFLGWATNALVTVPQFTAGQQVYITGNMYLYAIWEEIIVNTRTVTGFVWPMVTEHWGLGDSFLNKHAIVVELRATFNTPAPANLSTKPISVNTNGLGQFTFENVPYGTYVLYISRPGYLIRSMMVTISPLSPPIVSLAPPGAADAGVFNLWPGDCNGEWKVDNDDLALIIDLMGRNINALSPYYNAACDLNADGWINNMDINLLYSRWGDTILMYAGAGDVNPYI